MYARSTTVSGDPAKMDDGFAYVRDTVLPAVDQLPGCTGLSMLADRETGRCIVTTAWRDEESMHDTESAVHDLRRRAGEIFGGRTEVQEWDIALVHRAHEAHHGACTRVIWGQTAPERMDDTIRTFRTEVLERLEELPGFCAITTMVDRETGRTSSAVTYDSRADMAAARSQATALRESLARQMDMEITDVAEFDLVLAGLRVPETV